MVASGVRVSPAASLLTWNRLTPASVRAATRMISAVWPSTTYILVPSSVYPSPDAVAVMVMPASSHLPLSSVNATVATVPAGDLGEKLAFARSSPEWIKALAASTTLEK